MTVRYHVRRNISFPDYVCQRAGIERCEPGRCQDIPGTGVDKFISDLLLQMVSPMMIDTAMAVQDELQARISDADELRKKHIERVRYEAELARRRYLRVDPDNRLVAASLEADWNQQLRMLTEVQEQYEKQRSETELQLTDKQRAEISALSSNFSALWNDSATADRDKKRIVRLIIEDVTLRRHDDGIQIDIRFKGGACHSAQLPRPLGGGELRKTPDEVVAEIERLSVDFTDAEIAQQLNKRRFVSGTGKAFNTSRVKRIRYAYGLNSLYDWYKEQGYRTTEELSEYLGIRLHEVFQLRDKGVITGCLTTNRKDLLFAPLSRKEVRNIRTVLAKK